MRQNDPGQFPCQVLCRSNRFLLLGLLALVMIALALALPPLSPARAQTGGVFDLTWWTVDGGGATWCSGGTFTLGGTAGQPDAGPYSGGAFTLEQSGFWHHDDNPTAVRLARFVVLPKRSYVLLEWETASERDNAGFNVYRSAAPNVAGARLNAALIPSRSPGGGEGAVYEFRDETAVPGVRYYYTLEDVDLAGRPTRHGPVALGRWGVYLPLVGRY